MDAIWLDIIRDALFSLIEKTSAAVPGAKLRYAVATKAAERGLDFPPPHIRKFSELVEAYPAEFIVQRRPGSDILVLPTSRPELLVAESTHTSSSARIRQDFFEALTRLPVEDRGEPYYAQSTDTILYVRPGEQVPAAAVKLPSTSLSDEIQLREEFITSEGLPDSANASLKAALSGESPLRNFSHAVQQYGLMKRWHVYRASLLSRRLRDWALQNAIPWQLSWIESGEQRVSSLLTNVHVTTDQRQQLGEIAKLLTDADLARITVPMDIVLRLLSNR